jgi:diguanylate cyclase (GGDEF)-like protein
MRRYACNLKAGIDPPAGESPAGDVLDYRLLAKAARDRRLHVLGRDNSNSRRPLRGEPTPSLPAEGKSLAQILREVDNISRSLKLNPADTQKLKEAFHSTVMGAIRHSILTTDLQSLALTDDLTTLYNRRAFFTLATQQLRFMRRKGRGLLLFFADVDGLKRINDTYGHKEGDFALIRTASALERTFRDSDIIARLSGDEFAVLALEASDQDQAAILSRLQEQLQIASADEPRYKLSLSLGMARFDPKQGGTLADLLSKADRAMYEEKKSHLKMLKGRP